MIRLVLAAIALAFPASLSAEEQCLEPARTLDIDQQLPEGLQRTLRVYGMAAHAGSLYFLMIDGGTRRSVLLQCDVHGQREKAVEPLHPLDPKRFFVDQSGRVTVWLPPRRVPATRALVSDTITYDADGQPGPVTEQPAWSRMLPPFPLTICTLPDNRLLAIDRGAVAHIIAPDTGELSKYSFESPELVRLRGRSDSVLHSAGCDAKGDIYILLRTLGDSPKRCIVAQKFTPTGTHLRTLLLAQPDVETPYHARGPIRPEFAAVLGNQLFVVGPDGAGLMYRLF